LNRACPPLPARRPDWIHEIKHDGFRLMAGREGLIGFRQVGALVRTRLKLFSQRLRHFLAGNDGFRSQRPSHRLFFVYSEERLFAI
jgi:hypothetical protein